MHVARVEAAAENPRAEVECNCDELERESDAEEDESERIGIVDLCGMSRINVRIYTIIQIIQC